MPEPISLAAITLVGSAALYGYGRCNTGVSTEAQSAKKVVEQIIESKERSLYLFGPKAAVISAINQLATEHSKEGPDGVKVSEIDAIAVRNAEDFIRALPYGFPMPEAAVDPDGAISLDWILSRDRIFSLSIASSNRFSLAWIDGTERGHAVVVFDGVNLPRRFISQIRPFVDYAQAASLGAI
jgi:hypothetical protein